ncbi:hypothetical protein CVT25_007956 [Psilocybe cyanescens]|uniref:BTB domain-containing protein n=1 Tax=Psilocybe cyanescens TaxID=93625 RepID=A0A409XMT9_PSICY|nr:hypothetical protein CVT25_007956 [Psilocybe cyanescens]
MSNHYNNRPGPSSKFSDVYYKPSSEVPGLATPPQDNHNWGTLPDSETSKVPSQPPSEAASITISSSFFPGSHNSVSDTTFRSSEGVLFYTNARDILRTSAHAFEAFLGAPLSDTRFRGGAVIDIPESSAVLDVIVHTLYRLSCATHIPPFEDLETAVCRMRVYGMAPTAHIAPSTPLFDLLLAHAPLHPLRVYILGAHFGLHALAVRASAHLLAYDLAELTDELSRRMGPVYLNRLMGLHFNTVNSLKSIILQPPGAHAKTKTCDVDEQKKMSRAWALAASYLAWDANPGQFPPSILTPNPLLKKDVSIRKLRSTFEGLGDHLSCDDCKAALHARINEVIVQWVKVKILLGLYANARQKYSVDAALMVTAPFDEVSDLNVN